MMTLERISVRKRSPEDLKEKLNSITLTLSSILQKLMTISLRSISQTDEEITIDEMKKVIRKEYYR